MVNVNIFFFSRLSLSLDRRAGLLSPPQPAYHFQRDYTLLRISLGPLGREKKLIFKGASPAFKPQASHRGKTKSISKSKHPVFLNCCPHSSIHTLSHTQPPHWHPSPHIQLITIGEPAPISPISPPSVPTDIEPYVTSLFLQSIHFIFSYFLPHIPKGPGETPVTVLTCHLGRETPYKSLSNKFPWEYILPITVQFQHQCYMTYSKLNISLGPTA